MSRTCYIVGGHTAHIDRQIAPFLERCGIRVAGQLDYKAASHPQHMPRTDGVLLMADMVSHKVSDWATVEAKRQNIKIVIGISKKAVLKQRLQDAGWLPAPAAASGRPARACTGTTTSRFGASGGCFGNACARSVLARGVCVRGVCAQHRP